MTTETPLQLGMIGLGRMGAGIVRRLLATGTRVGYDVNEDAVAALEARAPMARARLEELAAKLEPPRAVWVMVPAVEITAATIRAAAAVLEAGDVVIDGGNTYYRDDIQHAAELAERGIHHVDVGIERRRLGVHRGFCLMIGGETDGRAAPRAAVPPAGARRRCRRAHTGAHGRAAYVRVRLLPLRPNGAGHFVKMVHNGIEYGLMAAYAEGLNILRNADGERTREADAETAPLANPEYYRYEIDTTEVTEVWRRGSVIGLGSST